MINKILNENEEINYKLPYALFSYANAKKYGLNTDTFSIYKTGKYYFSLYRKSLHILSKNISKNSANEIAIFAKSNHIHEIRGSSKVIKKILILLSNTSIKNGYVLKLLNEMRYSNIAELEVAKNADDLMNIAKLVCLENKKTNSNYYSVDEFYQQIFERWSKGYTRNFFLKCNEEIIATCSTYAETSTYGVIGGLVVKEEYRRNHYGSSLFLSVMNTLLKENKEAWLFCFNEQILNFYLKFTRKKYKYSVLYIDS